MANYIRDIASGELVARIHNNPMPLRCKYSTQAKTNSDQSQTLINPLDGRIDSPELNEEIPDYLPIAEEINPREFLILGKAS